MRLDIWRSVAFVGTIVVACLLVGGAAYGCFVVWTAPLALRVGTMLVIWGFVIWIMWRLYNVMLMALVPADVMREYKVSGADDLIDINGAHLRDQYRREKRTEPDS